MAMTRSARLVAASLGRRPWAATSTVALFNSAALNRTFTVDMPLGSVADKVAEPFAPFLDELAKKPGRKDAAAAAERPLYVPSVPKVLCISRMAAESRLLRDVLVVDTAKPLPKPRLSWYNPYDQTWIPSGWFADGLVADMNYYFGDLPKSTVSATSAGPAPPQQPTGA